MRVSCWAVLGVSCGAIFCRAAIVSAEAAREPSFLHGVAQVVGGVILELPKTIVYETMTEPPVLGTAVGLLAGTARALQVTAAGIAEMASTFDPWGRKKRH